MEITKKDFLIIFLASVVSLVSNIIYNMFDGSAFSIIQILVVSLATVVSVTIATIFILVLFKIFGGKIKD